MEHGPRNLNMTKKECKNLIIRAGYHPTPALVMAVLTAIHNMVTPALVEREFKKLVKAGLASAPQSAKSADVPPPKPSGMPPIPGMPPKPTS